MIRIDGSIDTMTSTGIEKVIKSLMDRRRYKIIVDLGGVDYISSVARVVYRHHASMPDRLIYFADMALLEVKAMGRDRAVIFKMEFVGGANFAKGSLNESRQKSIS